MSLRALCGAGCVLWAITALSAGAEPPFYLDKTKLLVWRDADGKEHAITRAEDWLRRREHILASMQLVMGPQPGKDRVVPLDVQVSEVTKGDGWVRKKLTFVPEKGDRVPAYLLLPAGSKGKVPAVLCLHQTNGRLGKDEPAGLGGKPDLHYALHLVQRGYVTLALDYPNFGESRFDPYANGYQSATMKAIWNNRRAIDLLQALPEVDGERIGCIGHSLGGHNTMFTAVFDERIKAAVSNCGFNAFPKYMGGDLRGWSHKGYMPRIASTYGARPEKMPFDFPEVVAALAPRAFLASAPTGDDNFEVSGVRDCIAAALPVYELLGAKEKLSANYPNCKHDFPPEVRKVAYGWLDRWLK
jgi:pimeloyl-ACP methyl ester carboxylesterase